MRGNGANCGDGEDEGDRECSGCDGDEGSGASIVLSLVSGDDAFVDVLGLVPDGARTVLSVVSDEEADGGVVSDASIV
jgi:hypothetical protein